MASAKIEEGLQAEATALHGEVRSSAASKQQLPRTRGRSVKHVFLHKVLGTLKAL